MKEQVLNLPKSGKKYKKEYKKIAMRFLKEVGLINQWRKYVKSKNFIGCGIRINENNWFDVSSIDKIFGRTLFTAFVRNSGVNITGFCVSDLFRLYLYKNYANEYKFNVTIFWSKRLLEAVEKLNTFDLTKVQEYIDYEKRKKLR